MHQTLATIIGVIQVKHKYYKMFIGVILISCMLTGCGGGSGSGSYDSSASLNSYDKASTNGISYMNTADSYGYDNITESAEYNYDKGLDPQTTEIPANTDMYGDFNLEKLVYTANIEVEVKDFEEAVQQVKDQLSKFNGVVQYENYWDSSPYNFYLEGYSSEGYRNYDATVRVPTKDFETFTSSIDSIGHTKRSSTQVDNISQQYYDSKAYLDSYKEQLKVLQGMYSKANTIEEMLTIEQRISNVNAEIMKLTTEIKSMDMDVAYSTIELHITEVRDYSETPREVEEKKFISEVKDTFLLSCSNFIEFMQDLILAAVYNFWKIIIIVVVVYLLRLANKKGKINIKQMLSGIRNWFRTRKERRKQRKQEKRDRKNSNKQ